MLRKFVVAGAVVAALSASFAFVLPSRQPASAQKPSLAYEDEEEERQDDPAGFAAMWAARLEGTGELSPAQVNLRANAAVDAAQALRRNPDGTAIVPPAWGFDDIGPGNFGGRSRALVVNPVQTNRVLVGSVSGGVWRSEDGGSTWAPVGDFLANIAVNSMVIDPDDPNRVFAGTGEGVGAGDAARGAGIFVTTDFGTTWTQLASTDNPDFFYVNRMAMIPGTDVIVAATRTGLWRSTNLGGAWTQVTTGFYVDGRGYADLKADPGTPNRMLAYAFGTAAGRGVIPQIDLGVAPIISGVRQNFTTSPTAVFPPGFTATNIRIGNDGVGVGSDGCEAFPAGFFTGRYALVDRGTCAFTIKVKNAQNAGAIGAIIAQNIPDAPFVGGGSDNTITIPSMMISQADGARIRGVVAATGVLFASGFEDAAIAPNDTTAAQVGGPLLLTNFVARSIDGGVNWTQLTAAEGLPETNITRGELAWGPGGVAYIAYADASANPATRGLWRSADGGATWTQTASTAAFIERQGDYDLTVLVDPANANKVYMGAVDQWITTDGGATITKNSFWNPGAGQMPDYIHADHHGYFAKPGDPNTVYTVSDGGVHRSTDGGLNYTEQNFGYNVAMPNNVTLSPDGTRAIVGTQDNGSLLYFGSSAVWVRWAGGDGGVTAFDQQDPNFFYSEQPFARFFGTNTGGNNAVVLPVPGSGSNTNGGLFYAPIALDPLNGNRMLIGTGALQLSVNARLLNGATFTTITPPAGFGTINSISFSPLDSNVAYIGSTGGALLRMTGIGTTNTLTSIQGNLPLGNDISQVLVDTSDVTGNTLYVVRADYGSQRIHRTTNGGTSWTAISGNLPDIPLYSVARDELVPGGLFVGSELGLWHGVPNGGNYDWVRYDYGIPHARVFGLTRFDADTLYVAVYGRGSFKATRSPLRVSVGELRNDSGCDSDGNLDPGDTAQVPVTVRNVSGTTVGPVTVSLASPAIGPGVPQLIPALAPGATTLTFSVAAAPAATCGNATLTATALVNATTATATRDTAVDSNSPVAAGFVEDAEGATSRFAVSKSLGPDTWTRVNTSANSGTFSFFAANTNGFSEKNLTSPWLDVTSATATLGFAIRYDTEGDATQRWDGVVLEARTRANLDATPGAWLDVGVNSTVPYDGLLFNSTALGPARPAWSGSQLTWRTASVPLNGFNGQQLQFRFRFVSDQDTAATGFWLDDVNLSGVNAKALPTCDAVCN